MNLFFVRIMKTFFEKDKYTIEDIQLLITNEAEESIHLEFKDARALSKSEGKKKEISKDVSAFANSDGGIIIYGIIEEDHKASKINYVDGNIYTSEWLEQVINSTIQRRINKIEIQPIRIDGDISKTIYIVKIPVSDDAPHICIDKRFYRRFNFESVQMEEYEVRNSYYKKTRSNLVICGWVIREEKSAEGNLDSDYNIYECSAEIINDGDSVESQYKLGLFFKNFDPDYLVSWNPEQYKADYLNIDKGHVGLSFTSIHPIFPGEIIVAGRFTIKIPTEKLHKAVNTLCINMVLFHSNGESKVSYDFRKLIEFDID